ncbi:MAG: PTS glucitol/sorbitol transporter subunit IIA [Trichococcus flocculiformis]
MAIFILLHPLSLEPQGLQNSVTDFQEPMIILFDDSATEPLQQVSVIHRFIEPQEWFEPADGDRILFDEQEYRISYIGNHVLRNLQSIGHTTMIFKNWDEERLETSIYLMPAE